MGKTSICRVSVQSHAPRSTFTHLYDLSPANFKDGLANFLQHPESPGKQEIKAFSIVSAPTQPTWESSYVEPKGQCRPTEMKIAGAILFLRKIYKNRIDEVFVTDEGLARGPLFIHVAKWAIQCGHDITSAPRLARKTHVHGFG